MFVSWTVGWGPQFRWLERDRPSEEPLGARTKIRTTAHSKGDGSGSYTSLLSLTELKNRTSGLQRLFDHCGGLASRSLGMHARGKCLGRAFQGRGLSPHTFDARKAKNKPELFRHVAARRFALRLVKPFSPLGYHLRRLCIAERACRELGRLKSGVKRFSICCFWNNK